MEKRGVKYHRGRVGEALREEIETLVEGELADPRIMVIEVAWEWLCGGERVEQMVIEGVSCR